MFAWFKNIFDSFFKKKRESIGNYNDTKKKFTIKQNERKKFQIKAPQSSSSESGKLKAITKTRPKKCPYCRTENKITFTTKKKWKCKVCEYEWQ